ncbi:hypothetical protein [Vibrio europaeus]|uniref:hypothetical protein n=1 Tax=Vibrio europaeus TaxID=300876 RepID=UPI00233EED87|nr:hypothetical protein [Vibrio europaeus]MDC5711151.1 hypothetical protein [Vibrio europaeus]MDC5713180.1 hypothetical protein [Vibrio europaeus]
MKKVLIAIVSALLVCSPAMAKVTYDDAAKHDRALRAKVPKPNQQSTFSSSQIAGQTGSNDNWQTYYRGSTAGSIYIPTNATEVYVKITPDHVGGLQMFPRSSPAFYAKGMNWDGARVIPSHYTVYENGRPVTKYHHIEWVLIK